MLRKHTKAHRVYECREDLAVPDSRLWYWRGVSIARFYTNPTELNRVSLDPVVPIAKRSTWRDLKT